MVSGILESCCLLLLTQYRESADNTAAIVVYTHTYMYINLNYDNGKALTERVTSLLFTTRGLGPI